MEKLYNLKEAKILVVEDNEVNIALVSRILNTNGYNFIFFAKDGIEALEKVQKERPDIILMDIMMPRMDGITCLEKLKESEDNSDIPVLLLTALKDEEDIIRGFTSGAVDFLIKPFKEKEFIKRLENHLELDFLKKQYGHKMRNVGANAMIVTLNHEISHKLTSLLFNLERFESKGTENYLNGTKADVQDLIQFINNLNNAHGQDFKLVDYSGEIKMVDLESNIILKKPVKD